MSAVETVNIKSDISGDNPLGYIVINKSDFDEKKHELFSEADAKTKALSVEQIKAALAGKNISIPDGVTKKGDLQALLDTAQP